MPRVLVGMPAAGSLTGQAAAGLFCCSADRDLATVRIHNSSLPTHGFNLLWVEALNRRANGITHFAMQHSDVEPQAGWLDVLLAEMERAGLDVLGVPVPLKDERGLTSTAVGIDGEPWRVAKRLSMAEVFALPETFTSADVGGPLLLNTGLWACKLGRWAEDVCFTTNDDIAVTPDGVFVARVEPEDWNFSRQLHRLGVPVGCTRKVKLAHRGAMAFANTHAWGTMATDLDNAPEGQSP